MAVSKLISDLIASVEANGGFQIFIFTDLFHGYIDMTGKAGDAHYRRASDHTSILGSMSVYRIIRGQLIK